MRSGFEKLIMSRPTRVCFAFLAGTISAITVVAVFGLFAANFRHLRGPFLGTDAALLVAATCGSVVAIRVLRSGTKRRPMSYRYK
jgi:hypothetical protein